MAEPEEPSAAPVRPVAVLDANVLVPAGLRDLLLSCAHVKVFRPVWQDEILDEVHRNGVRLLMERQGLSEADSKSALEHTLGRMDVAFPDACAPLELWVPLVSTMTNHPKDRHVLAVAVGVDATHLVTSNLPDFPVASRPQGVAVVRPDRFLLDRLAEMPGPVVAAVEGMSRRLKAPPLTPLELAEQMIDGEFVPRFGAALRDRFQG